MPTNPRHIIIGFCVLAVGVLLVVEAVLFLFHGWRGVLGGAIMLGGVGGAVMAASLLIWRLGVWCVD